MGPTIYNGRGNSSLGSSKRVGLGARESGGMMESIVRRTGMPSRSRYSSFQKREKCREPESLRAWCVKSDCARFTLPSPTCHNIVTIVLPESEPYFIANRTAATRLTADDEPRNNPSSRARWRDIATASSSVTLRKDGVSVWYVDRAPYSSICTCMRRR
jgi:hypothetical protein